MIGDDSTTSRRPRRRPAPGTCPRWRSRRPPAPRPSAGSSSETNVAVVDGEQRVHRDQRSTHRRDRGPRRRSRPVGRVLDLDVDLEQPPVPPTHVGVDADDAVDLLAPAHGAPDDAAPVVAQQLDARRLRGRTNSCSRDAPVDRQQRERSTSISCSTASSHGTSVRPSTSSESTGANDVPPSEVRSEQAPLHLQAPDPHVKRRLARPGSTITSVRIDQRSDPSTSRVAPAARARRTASAAGSSAPTPGTGRARSPRRARRRRRGAPAEPVGRARRRSGLDVAHPPPPLPSAAARTSRPTSAGARVGP